MGELIFCGQLKNSNCSIWLTQPSECSKSKVTLLSLLKYLFCREISLNILFNIYCCQRIIFTKISRSVPQGVLFSFNQKFMFCSSDIFFLLLLINPFNFYICNIRFITIQRKEQNLIWKLMGQETCSIYRVCNGK